MNVWQVEPTTQFTADSHWYAKKRPDELKAVLNNLGRYVSQLREAKNAACVHAGYLHPEPHGIIAIDQKGGGGNLQETRFYVFPDQVNRILYLITIGNKNEQQDDIKLATRFVESLKKTD